MSMIRRFLAGLFMALLLSGAAHAAEPVVQYRTVLEGVWHSSREAACNAWAPLKASQLGASWSVSNVESHVPTCVWRFYYSPTNYYTNHSTGYEQRAWCPGTGAPPVGGQCEDTCQAGQPKVLTFGSAWASSPEDIPDPGTFNLPPTSWCDGSCFFSFNDLLSVDVDLEPSSNGYYEITTTNEYIGTGAACGTASEPPENPDPEPPCGDGNCTPGDGDGDGGGDGDGDGGGDPGDGVGDGDDGDNPGGENPGDGAGGDGDGDGDGDGSGSGGGPGGNGEGEGEDEGTGECGIDGKPACKVKIDESGMPSDSERGSALDAARTAALGAVDDGADTVSKVLGEDFPEVEDVPWLWNVSLPAGACSPISFNTRVITSSYDVCSHPLMTAWREAWAYLIGVLGAIYIWRRTMASVGSA